MEADQLFSGTLEQLHQTKILMTSPEWDVKIQAASASQRQQAQAAMLRVQQACLAMENASLEDIADQLSANEQSLIDGQNAIEAAMGTLTTVQSTLKAVTSLVNVVAKIVPLV